MIHLIFVEIDSTPSYKKEILLYPNNPWDWYIYLHVPQTYAVNVGKYIPYMNDVE